jgi:hypothetical protein
MAIARSQKHQRPEFSGVKNLSRLNKRSMITVIESHANKNAVFFGKCGKALHLTGVPPGRLLHENVLSRFNGSSGYLSERSIERRNNDSRHIISLDGLTPVSRRNAVIRTTRQLLRSFEIVVRAYNQTSTGKGSRALLADQTASHDCEIH